MAASRFSRSIRPVILRKRNNRCHRSEKLSQIKVHVAQFGTSHRGRIFVRAIKPSYQICRIRTSLPFGFLSIFLG
jgi:hypothetical protein